jgi:SAM-dependent methyltransferase
MNTAKLKSYAPQARKDFIAAVQARANLLGLSVKGGKLDIAPSEQKGDIVVIAGQAWPGKVHQQRERLIQRINEDGFGHTMEAVAYTWFNRFAALRYMELHDYLDHGYRVLSSREGGLPEILARATELVGVLPGLNAAQIADLKLAGNKDGELYRLLLVAQCNALSSAMPFLFERIDDESELLLPDNLIRTDSLIRSLVDEIPEADWSNIEIIGWLYQFYISEKKDQVIGKVVKSEDIPAATQLFTPNWIVKYMVQNSLGAQWLTTYPDSPLAGQMEYYIEPAEQTDEVKAQLAAITPSQLNPEELTLIDPACGSGHILVEAYELFKAIYLERGYRQRDVPELILEKNLFGLDIDERAAQLTGFALMMKGRADDRRLFERGVKLNVMALVDSAGFDAEELGKGVELSDYALKLADLTELKRLFEHATTFGSLIQVSEGLAEKLPGMKKLSKARSQDMFVSDSLMRLGPLVQQAKLLATQYDAVVANPPYMGSGFFSRELKSGLTSLGYQTKRSDLYVAFLDRARLMALSAGRWSMVTRQDWMHTRSYGDFRSRHIGNTSTVNLVHLGKGAFPELSGEVVQACCMTVLNRQTDALTKFVDVTDLDGLRKREHIYEAGRQYSVAAKLFPDRFGSAFMYRMSKNELMALQLPAMEEEVKLREGIHTGKNDLFIRLWWEVSGEQLRDTCRSIEDIDSLGARWIPYNKGGNTRRWFFDTDFTIRFDRSSRHEMAKLSGHVRPSKELYFLEGGTWSDVASRGFGVRYFPAGYLFADAGPIVVGDDIFFVLALMNSKPFTELAKELMPNLHFKCGTLQKMPYVNVEAEMAAGIGATIVQRHRDECRGLEAQRIFDRNPLLLNMAVQSRPTSIDPTPTLESSYTAWITQNRDTIAEMKRLEGENNRLFIDAYGLADELTPDVPIEQITLTVNPAYRYGGKLTEEEQWTRFRQDTIEELVSYAIGCMMGRYSLDEPGLIYAHAGNVGFDATRYQTFPADADGIVPITDELWFEDDAANRVREFLLATWGAEKLDQNIAFLADNLGAKASEAPIETIRRYLANQFFKDHLQTYKKRPIYWLFSSGKQGAFAGAGLSAPLPRRHARPHARRIRRAPHGQDGARIEMLEKDRDAAAQPPRATRSPSRLRAEEEARRTPRLRRKAPPLRRHAHQSRSGRRGEGELRQVRRSAGGGEGGDGRCER